MKKLIAALLVVMTIAAATAGKTKAQGGDKNIAFIAAKNHAAYVSFITQYGNDNEIAATIPSDTLVSTNNAIKTSNAALKTSKANLKLVKANNKALKNFNGVYKKDAPEATWWVGSEAIIATFVKDQVPTDVVYNKKGGWLHTITCYPASKTPEYIASIMDYNYPKDDIFQTFYIEEGTMKFYIVQLESKTTLKKVVVYDNDVNLVQELHKPQ